MNYFIINLHKSLGQGRETRNPWICSQTCLRSGLHAKLVPVSEEAGLHSTRLQTPKTDFLLL